MSERSELRRIQRNLDFIIAASDKQDVGLVLEWWTVTVKNQKDYSSICGLSSNIASTAGLVPAILITSLSTLPNSLCALLKWPTV